MLDNIILLVFGVLSPLALAVGFFGFWMAVRASKLKEADLRMFFWAVLGLAGFVFSLVSFAYFLLPILSARLFD
jgi:hypothetical protein